MAKFIRETFTEKKPNIFKFEGKGFIYFFWVCNFLNLWSLYDKILKGMPLLYMLMEII